MKVQSAKGWGIAKAKDLLKNAGLIKQDYTQWTNHFRETFDSIMLGRGEPKPYLIKDLFDAYERKLRAGAPLKQEWKNLYRLIGAVISFQKLMELSQQLGHNEETINRHYRILFQNLTDDVASSSANMAVQSQPFAFDEFVEKLKDESKKLLTSSFCLSFDRTSLYCLLWTDLFKKKNWREEEIQWLDSFPDKTLPIKVGLIHLQLHMKDDDQALMHIKSCNEVITPYFFNWFELLTTHRDWQRMEPLVVEFISRLRLFLKSEGDYYACRDFARMASSELLTFITETNKIDLLEKALSEMLPYSFYEYEELLFDKEDYDKWLELRIFTGLSLDSLSKDRIKILQAMAPHVLLPLYHQAIQAHIDGKSRDHYKQAVRQLKKLRTLYKKLKKTDDWERFMDILLVRTKRLRAFHEECQRGKLIDA